ncbi:sodium:solute symporter [Candidatus Latescibacterota bacterium]
MILHPLDIIVLLGYLLVILFIGLWSTKKIKNTGDFFLAGRRLGKFMTAMLNFGTGTHSDQAVGVISKTYQVGLAGIWYQWLWLLKTPFDWIMSPIYRRLRVVTCADYFGKRFNQSVATLYSVMGIIILMLNMGTMLLGSGRIIEALTNQQIPFAVSVIGMTVLFVSYGMAGGFLAAALTDVLQGVLTIILSFLILPFAIIRVGGFAGLHEKLADNPHDMFSLINPEITVFFIIMTVINGIVNIAVQPHTIPISTACKTEMESRIGVTYGTYIKRICTVAWAFTGLCAIALFPGLENPDHAFGEIARILLPTGLIGLLLASVLASVQSSCDAFMVTASGIFTRNIYRVYFAKDKTESHYLFIGRISSLFIVMGGLGFAFFLPGVIAALELFWKLPALLGIPFWMGIFWRRANPASVWISFISAAATFITVEMKLFVGIPVPLPWQMLAYLSAGLVGGLVGGYVTKPQPKEFLDRFYSELHKPVDEIEHLATDTM